MGNFRDNYNMKALLLWMGICPCCWSGYIITEMVAGQKHTTARISLSVCHIAFVLHCVSVVRRGHFLDVLTFCSLRNTGKEIYV